MKLVVGLGNPGSRYALTRHNVGFMVIDYLISQNSLSEKERFGGLYSRLKIKDEEIILFKPQTFMNLSGEPLVQIMNFFKINIEDILVIYDDLDLKTGVIRLRENGGSGGHNGVKSIIQHLSSDSFKRMRIGIDKNPLIDSVDYVLGKLTKEEMPLYKETIIKAANIVLDWPSLDYNRLMTKYNQKKEIDNGSN